jgi:hypothetical protein
MTLLPDQPSPKPPLLPERYAGKDSKRNLRAPPKPPPLWPAAERHLSHTTQEMPPPPGETTSTIPAGPVPVSICQRDGEIDSPRKSLTSFAISLTVHVFGLLLLALLVVSTKEDSPARVFVFSQSEDEPVEFDQREMPAIEMIDAAGLENIAEWDIPEDVAPDIPEVAVVVENELMPVDLPPSAEMNTVPKDQGMRFTRRVAGIGNNNSDRPKTSENSRRGDGNGLNDSNGGQENLRFDGELGRRLKREGGQTGSIQVSLLWNNLNDIDLHVFSPTGERIFFLNRHSQCGGQLDVDMNHDRMSTEPVENIFWPENTPLWGNFLVYVHFYARKDRRIDATEFQVHILVDGEKQVFHGNVAQGMPPVFVTGFLREPGRRPPDF